VATTLDTPDPRDATWPSDNQAAAPGIDSAAETADSPAEGGSADDYAIEDDIHPASIEPPAVEAAPGNRRIWWASGIGAALGLLVIAMVAVLVLGRTGSPAFSAAGAGQGAGAGPAGTPLYEAPAVGYRAPRFTLTGLDGKAVSLEGYRGHPVWINLWATWCPPCRAEMPEMKQLYARYQSQGLVILGVDVAEGRDTVNNFIAQNGYNWTFVLDSDSRVGQLYNASGIPTHAFVDATGVVRAYQIGGLSVSTMESNLTQIMPKTP